MSKLLKYLWNLNRISKNRHISSVTYCQVIKRNYCQKFDRQTDIGGHPTDFNRYTSRSHTCGELGLENVGQQVTIVGWLQYQRMSQFAVLRDAYGITQIVLPENREDLKTLLGNTPLESVVAIKGRVEKRPENQINEDMLTGAIEIMTEEFNVVNRIERQLPFTIRDYQKANEALRMKYRYLDLRFPMMQKTLRLRSQILTKMREFLSKRLGFVEVETPTLFKKTPGGAQEFLVPTQTRGNFYSLVQSPQQLKQLLMVGGVDRYFQIARCYRDESSRPDRQPEFTQLDIELSFATTEDVMNLVEDLIKESLCGIINVNVPFKRILFKDSMELYGTDQPDLTISCMIQPLKDIELPNGVVAKFLKIPDSACHFKTSMKQDFRKLKSTISSNASLHFLKYPGSDWNKYSSNLKGWNKSTEHLIQAFDVKPNDLVFVSIGPTMQVLKLLGKIRSLFIASLREIGITGAWETDRTSQNLTWVTDFPLFEENDDRNLKAAHHPFTSPHPDDIELLTTNPLKVRGLHYDLVMNGWEIGGGSVRIHNPNLQKFILADILKIKMQDLSHLLEALESGAPPHAGIALGIDRLISIILGTKSIRDVIAFPKTSDGNDLLTGAPSQVSQEELDLYKISVNLDEELKTSARWK